MALINAVAFRLPANRVWQYQNSVLFDSFYAESIRNELFLTHFFKKFFEKSHFKRYKWVFSHLTTHRFINNQLSITIFFYGKFYRGLIRFLYRRMYPLCLRYRRRRNRRLVTFYTFHRAMGRLNRALMTLLFLYRVSLLKTVRAYFSGLKLNLNFRLLNYRSFSASYFVNYFAYKLNTGTDLNYILKSTFIMFEKRIMKGVKGIKIVCAGRFTRKQRAHSSVRQIGFVQTSSIRSKVDYALMTTKLKYGASSIRIWVNYK